MIIEGQIVSRPYSGEYDERIYDNNSSWNSQNWTYIKFTNGDYSDGVVSLEVFRKPSRFHR